MAVAGVAQQRLLLAAAVLGERAAGVEAATGWRREGLGTSPASSMRFLATVGSGRGIADSRAWV
jgi:hypothetical protein